MLNPRFGLVVLGLYGVLLIVGGVMGYLKARSRASLIAGVVSGIIAFIAVFISSTYNEDGGFGIGLTLAIAMFLFFGPRAVSARKFVPMGMMAVASVIVIGVMMSSF